MADDPDSLDSEAERPRLPRGKRGREILADALHPLFEYFWLAIPYIVLPIIILYFYEHATPSWNQAETHWNLQRAGIHALTPYILLHAVIQYTLVIFCRMRVAIAFSPFYLTTFLFFWPGRHHSTYAIFKGDLEKIPFLLTAPADYLKVFQSALIFFVAVSAVITFIVLVAENRQWTVYSEKSSKETRLLDAATLLVGGILYYIFHVRYIWMASNLESLNLVAVPFGIILLGVGHLVFVGLAIHDAWLHSDDVTTTRKLLGGLCVIYYIPFAIATPPFIYTDFVSTWMTDPGFVLVVLLLLILVLTGRGVPHWIDSSSGGPERP